MLMTDTLIPIQISDTKKSREGKTKYKTITFYDPVNNREVKTHVVSSYGNYRKWAKVINLDLDQHSAILRGNFKFKDIDVVDADCGFEFIPGITFDQIAEIVESCQQKHRMGKFLDAVV